LKGLSPFGPEGSTAWGGIGWLVWLDMRFELFADP